ncbi:MAG: mannose-1-phosphate guanylyltransferase [Bacteroidetes bacterium]|nr:mannose-1-phosphate guanylyltransferase [Bacteroidota bacterium]
MIHAVIMAGGIGSRFWPMSRRDSPKQFLSIVGEDTLIQNTVARLNGIVPMENCHVVTHARYVESTLEQIPSMPPGNVLAEPISKNTAPCIAYAAMKIYQKDPNGIMVVLPADHVIRNVRKFHQALRVGIEKANEENALVTIGIEPTFPATGYGYIQFDPEDSEDSDEPVALFVKTFAEKPNMETAERFIDSGDFLWNSGMFIWRADSILNSLEKHLPEVFESFSGLGKNLTAEAEADVVLKAFQACPSISIDYGVMERADKVYVVPGSFDWSDVGDWKAVYELREKGKAGNAVEGNVILHDASRCFVQAGNKLVALIGVNDLIVVNTEDALLVCHQEATQRVKNIVDYLYTHHLDEYV